MYFNKCYTRIILNFVFPYGLLILNFFSVSYGRRINFSTGKKISLILC